MAYRRKNLFKTLVFSKSQITDIVEIFVPFFVFIALIFSLNIDFTDSLDIFFSNERAYAELNKLKDETNMTKAILEGYSGITYKERTDDNTTYNNIVKTEETKITEKTVTPSAKINNQTNIAVDVSKFNGKPLYFIKDKKEPCILIIHTHTTESYYDKDRNIDDEKNMIRVGKAVKDKLASNGIKVIHDTTVHDYPSYNGAYTRSYATVTKQLGKNPQINIILDLHRDAVSSDDGSKVSLVCDVKGEKTAQIMLVVGTNAQLQHDFWEENLNLALKLQNMADTMYPGFARPVNLREQRFNQQASKGSIIVEVGANGNTLDEAVKAGERFAEVLIGVLKS